MSPGRDGGGGTRSQKVVGVVGEGDYISCCSSHHRMIFRIRLKWTAVCVIPVSLM